MFIPFALIPEEYVHANARFLLRPTYNPNTAITEQAVALYICNFCGAIVPDSSMGVHENFHNIP